jgi:hypothetical protein
LGSQHFSNNEESMEGSWAHRRLTSLTQAYKNLFHDRTSASIKALTTLRSSFSLYLFFVCNHLFSRYLFR